MRRFLLRRVEDISGISGVGDVAEGVLFSTGKTVLQWTTEFRSVAIYDSLDELMTIHSHDGRTLLVWLDQE